MRPAYRGLEEAAHGLDSFAVKFTSNGPVRYGSMCWIGDGDSLDVAGWEQLSAALLAIRAALAAAPGDAPRKEGDA